MSSSTNKSDSSPDDLTTDAIPNPPRDDQEQVNNNEKQPEENVTRKQQQQQQQHNNHEIPKSTGFTKNKKNTPPGAFTSLININNSNNVHIGNVYVNKLNPKDQEKQEETKTYVITPEIKTLLSSDKVVTTKHIGLISSHMGSEEWKNTAATLHYTKGQISQFLENHSRSGIKEVIYQFLLDWIQNNGNGATIGKLSSALWETNQQEVVVIWSKECPQ